MVSNQRIRLGIVGVCGRGACYKDACDSRPDDIVISAVCDTNVDGLADAARRYGAEHQFSDFETMLDSDCVDAVMIGTPMQFHAPQAIAALDRNIAVFSEVTAGVSIEECRNLVLACNRSNAVYMMGENYAYLRNNVAIREMVRAGLFGELYYAEGEYLHELKTLNEVTKWRRRWQTGINGVTYPTHSLGPILQWFDGQRVTSVSCAGSGHHYRDARDDAYEHEDTCLMLCRMSGGGLVKIRVDMLSDRPHNMAGYALQGTMGCYESARGLDESDKIWLRHRDPAGGDKAALPDEKREPPASEWERFDTIVDDYLPDWYKAGMALAEKAGHGGGDLYTVLDFIDAVHRRRPSPIGIHEAMDMTLPGLISQQSIQQDGQWLAVPDSRNWTAETAETAGQQLIMAWPEKRRNNPPDVNVPAGYRLRQYRPADREAHSALAVLCGFDIWQSPEAVEAMVAGVVPGGFFIIEHESSGDLAAAAVGNHNPSPQVPVLAELGWVVTHPDHRGKGLGRAVSAAVTCRLLDIGYDSIYLRTDDHRLAALKIYLLMGYEPSCYADGMAERWAGVRSALP